MILSLTKKKPPGDDLVRKTSWVVRAFARLYH
jgi:hypothetical protein